MWYAMICHVVFPGFCPPMRISPASVTWQNRPTSLTGIVQPPRRCADLGDAEAYCLVCVKEFGQICILITMHWRPSCVVPSLSVFLPKDVKWHHGFTLWCHVMSWCHIVVSHGVMGHHKKDLCNLHKSHNQKVQKSCFSKWRPWPLTYDLDLQTRPRYYKRQSSYQILGL